VRAGTAEGRLLLASLAWASGRGPELPPLVREVRRWPQVLRMAGRRGIGESLAFALAAGGALPELPAEVRERVRAAQEIGAARNLVLLTETARVQALLARRGIAAVALKGTALVAAHYPAVGARHVSDLDLLVPRGRLAEAGEALAREGTAEAPHLDHGGRSTVPSHLPPIDTPGGTSCELHFQVPGYRGEEMADRLLAEARSVAVPAGGAIRIPAPADCAAVACVHAFAGHDGEARYLPRLVADLEALDATAGLDWAEVGRAAGAEGARAVERGRALLERARAGRAEAVFPGTAAVLGRELLAPLARLAAADPRALVRAAFPAQRFMARRYGVPERSAKLLLYYVLRPLLAVRERLRR
jgi:putative nucleotidyltransferase-like protein